MTMDTHHHDEQPAEQSLWSTLLWTGAALVIVAALALWANMT